MSSELVSASDNPAPTLEQQDKILRSLTLTDSCSEPDARPEEDGAMLPKLHVMNRYYFEIYGVDAIWHNMYAGPNSDWSTFRKQYDANIDQMVQMVGEHLSKGLYSLISLNATKHSLTVVCASEKMQNQVLDELFRDPVPTVKEDGGSRP